MANFNDIDKSKSLQHSGQKGQKWGVRRWQNEDGTFNEEGDIRYGRVKKSKYFDENGDFNKKGLQRYGKSTKHLDELSNEQLKKLAERQDLENSVYQKMQMFAKDPNELTVREKIELKKAEAEAQRAMEYARQEEFRTRSQQYDTNNKPYENGMKNTEMALNVLKAAVVAGAAVYVLKDGLDKEDVGLIKTLVGGKK